MAEHGGHQSKEHTATAVLKMSEIKHKVLVMSGKGGVGKTTVAVNLAYTFAARGFNVGIVDTDIHGPNVALMTGVEGLPAEGGDGVIEPHQAADRVKVLSISGFLPGPDSPVVWRGPMKSGVIAQFLAEGNWEGIDLIVVDCPPGTGDEPLSVAQLIPDADGVVVVTQPQDVSLLDSRKCINFVRMLKLPVLGIVENMSGLVCPHCGERIDLFSVGGGRKAAQDMDVPFLGAIPITTKMVGAGDSGRPLVDSEPSDPAAVALDEIASRVEQEWTRVAAERKRARIRTVVVAAASMDGIKAAVSSQFVSAPAFVAVDVDEDEIDDVRTIRNPFADGHQSGQIPRWIHDELGAHVIIAGEIGSHAFDAFNSYGMQIVKGVSGTVADVVKSWMESRMPEGCAPSSCAGCSKDCSSRK
ncbi:MAG TPA: P-loop NTPase [Myxococcota bacterium]|nr:P-loop NTPase [Myxococcota bacterium]HOA14122.1 P-loop NTPase [Myxococcota bacterium]HOC99007.1 P-loop NTPase [Myxococcota bacterium]HOH77293.1 P-loop NTPase [Myxococcota bacterium]HPV04860.1 P-loop NTPase [Myxococcota bacterium]